MGEDLDPFGRKKGENPLASLGWHGDDTASSAEPEPGPVAPAAAAVPAARVAVGTPPPSDVEHEAPASAWPAPTATAGSAPPRTRERSLPRTPGAMQRPVLTRVIRWALALAIVTAVLGSVIGALVGEGVERADRFVREFEPPDVQVPAVPGTDENRPSGRAQATLPARGLSVNSLLRPAAFGKAITRLRTGGYGRLTNLRVAPDRIDASLLTRDGRLRQVQIVPGGAVRVIGTSGAGFAGARTITLKGIFAGAPNRLTRSAAGRLEQPASRVDYLVLSEFGGARTWNVYFKGGQIFSADPRGRITRRVS